MNKKKIILFDIDYTLLDTTRFKKIILEKIAKSSDATAKDFYDFLEGAYRGARYEGHFEPSLFPKLLKERVKTDLSEKELEQIWFDQDLIREALYPETISVLKGLQNKNIELGIFSTGNTEFQLAKIFLVEDMLHKNHIHIFADKEDKLEEIVQMYKDSQIYVVDDFITVLSNLKKLKPDAKAIWMKRGRFAEKAQIPAGFEPDAIITRLDELGSLFE